MTQQPEYLRYLESAKQAEVAEQLRAEGFTVETYKQLGDVQFDLIARKGPKAIAYEFKSGQTARTNREQLNRLQRAAKDAGLEFRIVVVTPPPRVRVEVEQLTEELQDYMINHAFLDELDSLSTHTRIDEVSDLEISDIHIGNGEIRVAGSGSVGVELQYGGDSDGVPSSGDAFPFRFRAVLTPEGQLKSVEELSVDTSSFYE
jgi:Holliday junction resolvase